MESFEEQDLPFEEMISRFIKMQFNFFITHDKRLAYFILDELVRNPVRLDSQLSAMKRLFKSSKGLEMRLQKEIAEGRVRKMTFFDLAVTIITLNSALFVSRPIIIKLLDISEEEYTALIKRRCQENIEIVLRSLRP